ncbi:MAG: hypothetical protein U5N55_08520 [Cypionkella sp.]|nr:hypothetical protein [Cypionkella sp.]
MLRAEGGDGVLHGLFTAVLAHADRFILVLCRVETVTGLGHDSAKIAGQAIPVFAGGLLGLGRTGGASAEAQQAAVSKIL